jgi:hypothetical protein
MKTSLRMTSDHHAQLMKHLFPGDGCEAVALLLCGRRSGDSRSVLTVRRVVPVPYESCSVRTPDQVQWSTDILDHLLPEIWKSSASIVKVHSHPTGFDRFSAVDDISDSQLAISFDCLFEEGRLHGSAAILLDPLLTVAVLNISLEPRSSRVRIRLLQPSEIVRAQSIHAKDF